MYIAVCDDQIEELEKVKELLDAWRIERGSSMHYKTYRSAAELLDAARRERFTLYLLDVLMPGMTGMDAARKIRTFDAAAEIVFLTTSPGFAYESYGVRAIEYLLKPLNSKLLYPVLDRRMKTESYRQFTDTPMCNSRDMEKYFAMYAPGALSAPREYLSPAESASLRGLPPAYIETAEFDCLRDEGEAYALRLESEGVPCERHEIKSAMHGYDIAVDSDLLRTVMALRLRFLRITFKTRTNGEEPR